MHSTHGKAASHFRLGRRVIEAIPKGPVFLCIGPIRNGPCVVIPTYTEKRPRGPLRFEIHEFAPNRQRGKLARLP